MRLARRLAPLAVLAALPACSNGQRPAPVAAGPLPRTMAPRPTSAAITEQDLMTRLYVFADDSMQGRATGTEGYRKATDYIAAELRRLGLQPAGDDGTYFQALPGRAIGAATRLLVGDAPLEIWNDFVPLVGSGMPRGFDGAAVVYGGALASYAQGATPPLAAEQIAGKVVVVSAPAGAPTGARTMNALAEGSLAAAAAIAVVLEEPMSAAAVAAARRTTFGAPGARDMPYVLLVQPTAASRLLGAAPSALLPGASGPTLRGGVVLDRTNATARNVVAVLPGSDPALRAQYVALGAHADHVGIATRAFDHDSLRAFNAAAWRARGANDVARQLTPAERARISVNVDSLRALGPARRDSINNGADDDGSGSMALLEVAEALAAGSEKPRRSVLFVWHAAEELGLLGAAHFAANPTVPRDSIVAQVNIDMIGRGGATDLVNGGPGYVAVVGASRLSRDFGALVDEVNRRQAGPLAFDLAWDRDAHPQNIYCRSDHAEYARFGIPVVFLFTGLHGDYHQVTDEPQYINYPNYTRIVNYVHDLVLAAAERPTRFALSVPKPDPAGDCRQ